MTQSRRNFVKITIASILLTALLSLAYLYHAQTAEVPLITSMYVGLGVILAIGIELLMLTIALSHRK